MWSGAVDSPQTTRGYSYIVNFFLFNNQHVIDTMITLFVGDRSFASVNTRSTISLKFSPIAEAMVRDTNGILLGTHCHCSENSHDNNEHRYKEQAQVLHRSLSNTILFPSQSPLKSTCTSDTQPHHGSYIPQRHLHPPIDHLYPCLLPVRPPSPSPRATPKQRILLPQRFHPSPHRGLKLRSRNNQQPFNRTVRCCGNLQLCRIVSIALSMHRTSFPSVSIPSDPVFQVPS